MKRWLPTVLALVPTLGCSTTSTMSGGATASDSPLPLATPPGDGACEGVLVPASAAGVSLWPEAFSGELLVLSVLEHGSVVAEGDALAELDGRRIDESINDAEYALRAARAEHQNLLERHAIAAEAAASKLIRTRSAVDRALRDFAGYEDFERKFAERQDELSHRRELAWEADQHDELAQLEAMYEADELVDGTEEIVLKRQRRDVAMTRASNELSRDRRSLRADLTRALEAESKKEDVAEREESLAHLVRTQSIDAAQRAAAEERSTRELERKERDLAELRRDRELLALRAPRAGVLLHGSLDDLRAGQNKRWERGSLLPKRSDAFMIAEPGGLALALELPETKCDDWSDGCRVVVSSKTSDVEVAGRAQVASLPSGSKGGESTFEVTVELDELAPGMTFGLHASARVAGQE